jgi:ABC-2 type transport system permease protein
MNAFLAMVGANIKMATRNRSALFWNLAFPAIFILIFGAVFSRGQNLLIEVAVTGDPSPYQAAVLQTLEDNDAFTVVVGDTASERSALQDGDLDALLVFGAPDASGLPAVELAYDETAGPNAMITVSVLRQVLVDVAQQAAPMAITVNPVSSRETSFIDFFVPGILAMSLMNSGVIGVSTAFVTYRERGILRRIKVTPFPLRSFILARVTSQLLQAIAQTAILVALAWAVFDMHLRGNLLVIALAIVVGALAFIAVGFAIAAISRDTEAAASYANLVTFPMLFLSGVFFDMDAAPAWLAPITRVLPLRYLVDGLREPMTRGNGISAIWIDLAALGATFVVGLAIAIRFFRWESRGN